MNLHSGGAVLAPWEIEPGYELDDWIEAAIALSNLPNIRARKKAQQQFFEKQRRAHPQYSHYRYRNLKPN